MLGRRRHERFTIRNPWEGVLHVLREVSVHRASDGSLTAIAQAPGVVGEVLTLNVWGGGSSARVAVRVVESRPQLVEGSLRHAVRLALVDGDEWAGRADVAC